MAEKLPDTAFAPLKLSTQVDERLNWSLEKRDDIGLFTKELEEALLDGRATLAVHSAKDMPTTCRHNLYIAGYLPAAIANDVLVKRVAAKCLRALHPAARAGERRSGPSIPAPSGPVSAANVGARLKKIAEGKADATVLAAAGLKRLNLSAREGLEFNELPIEKSVPAPGQAAIAVQCREADLGKYQDLFCEQTKLAVTLEREFLHRLGGGCQTPLGAHYDGSVFHIYHPEVGYATYEFELKDIFDLESILPAIIDELSL